MKAHGGVDVQIEVLLTSALVRGEWSTSRPGRFIHGERGPGTHWIEGWVNPRTGLDDVEKRMFLTLPGIEFRTLCRAARSQSLYRRYRLSYPNSCSQLSTYFKRHISFRKADESLLCSDKT
jgi:hypothetical protein